MCKFLITTHNIGYISIVKLRSQAGPTSKYLKGLLKLYLSPFCSILYVSSLCFFCYLFMNAIKFLVSRICRYEVTQVVFIYLICFSSQMQCAQSLLSNTYKSSSSGCERFNPQIQLFTLNFCYENLDMKNGTVTAEKKLFFT